VPASQSLGIRSLPLPRAKLPSSGFPTVWAELPHGNRPAARPLGPCGRLAPGQGVGLSSYFPHE